MSFEVKIIEDSISSQGIRLTTMQLMYPRFIHAEFMTHRVFSRNASSSRAIPVAKMIEQVRTNPAMPIHWGKNQPGMQANEQLSGIELDLAQEGWRSAAECAADIAETMSNLGLHKQVANRILEPFQHIHVIVTATDWGNFFALRCHEDAQPEIHHLAVMMRDAMDASTPKVLNRYDWHLPYITAEERAGYVIDDGFMEGDKVPDLIKMSAARCARVSYMLHDGTVPSKDKDFELFDRLVGSEPIHASPIEHQASPADLHFDTEDYFGNFYGWHQFRQLFTHEFDQYNT